jgi:YVTN family beta-propeller protein
VTNNGSASISVIDTKTNVVVDTASTPPLPWSVAIHPVRDELWLGCSSPEVLEVRSTTDLSVLARVAPTNQLHYASSDLAFRADGSEAFGAESCGECGRFHRISGTPSSGTVEILQSNITWYNPPGAAYTAAVHPTSGVAYLGKAGSVSNNHESPKIFEFADGAVRRMLTFTGRDYTPRAMEVAPDDGLLWVAQGWDQGFLSVVDPATMLAITTVEVGGNPQGLALTTQRTLFLPGDLNGDGRVGSEDLDIVRANWGAGVDAGCLSCGDPSGDGIVGSADLDLVRSNWGRTLRTAVPEPGTVVLGFVGAIALLRRRNASRRHPRDRINPNRIPPDGV